MIAHQTHEFGPLYKEDSQILILGSFPSVASREAAFFYGHKQNRFWKMLAAVFGEVLPATIEEKKSMCLRHHIALYDAIEECDIIGSSDASIRDPMPANLQSIVDATAVSKIICNGKTSYKYFCKFQNQSLIDMAVCLPSTSPANAAVSLEELVKVWKKELLSNQN